MDRAVLEHINHGRASYELDKRTSHMSPIMLEDPGLECTAQRTAHFYHRDNIPSVQPDTPRLSFSLSGVGRQGSILSLEPPEEECVVWEPRAVHGDAPGPVPSYIERDVRESLRDLEVYPRRQSVKPCSTKRRGRTYTSAIPDHTLSRVCRYSCEGMCSREESRPVHGRCRERAAQAMPAGRASQLKEKTPATGAGLIRIVAGCIHDSSDMLHRP
jgi:hypothetical protein